MMDLLTYQRAFMRMSFAAEPAGDDLASLGSSEAALLYRHMIRTRLVGMAKVAFKGTLEAVGEGAFAASFARYLAEAPPRSALIREVIAAFGPFARADRPLHASAPAALDDWLSFEEQKWRLAYVLLTSRNEPGLRELDFEGTPVWNPSLHMLALSHPVHAFTGGQLVPEACELFMYRPPGSDEVRWYNADPFFAALVRTSRQLARSSFGELIPCVAKEHDVSVDQTLLESLATSLTLAVERGVLLGVLDRS
jgi:hypothetical protein